AGEALLSGAGDAVDLAGARVDPVDGVALAQREPQVTAGVAVDGTGAVQRKGGGGGRALRRGAAGAVGGRGRAEAGARGAAPATPRAVAVDGTGAVQRQGGARGRAVRRVAPGSAAGEARDNAAAQVDAPETVVADVAAVEVTARGVEPDRVGLVELRLGGGPA